MILSLACDVCGKTSDIEREGWMQFCPPDEVFNSFSITTSRVHFEEDDQQVRWKDACSRSCVIAALDDYLSQKPKEIQNSSDE